MQKDKHRQTEVRVERQTQICRQIDSNGQHIIIQIHRNTQAGRHENKDRQRDCVDRH